MANNYQQFSTMIDCKNEERCTWLVDKLDKENEAGYQPNTYQVELNNRIWIYAEECGDIEALANLIAEFQEHFHLTEPWVLQWADYCSKLRVDEFSGGAVAVYKGRVKWFRPSVLADEWIQQQKKEG